jgi:site-specific recombinase XerD
MNMKDIALLKYSDFDRDKFEFQREKTKFTSKSQLEKTTVYLTPFIQEIIDKYGTPKKPENFVFDVVTPSDSAEERHRKIKLFIRSINGHLKKLCKANDLPEAISSNWARHSFATQGIRKGASMELMQELLRHGNIKTTQIYFNGFEDETKKEFAQNIMNFD